MRLPILLAVAGLLLGLGQARSPAQDPAPVAKKSTRAAAKAKPQSRPFGTKIGVDPATIRGDDGDTVTIRWPGGDEEVVRILGIDTPEVRHVEHNLPFDQPGGSEARAFAKGAFAVANDVQLLRSATVDPYDRTLGYLFLDGKNYSTLVVRAGLAAESVTFYGDNGLPEPAAEVFAAAKEVGPTTFEPPHLYRTRMRTMADWMKKNGTYPEK